ncbi:MAG: hypothetical protein ACHQIM_04050 [Sphingobacteriales bacterium]
MTTLTIEIPDDNSSLLSELIKLTKNAGLKVRIDNDEDNLSESEFQSLKKAAEEAVLIKKGLSKGIPVSELWND